MAKEDDRSQSTPSLIKETPTVQEPRAAIDSGRMGDKGDFPDLTAASLGTDDQASSTLDALARVATARRLELTAGPRLASGGRPRPLSPNIQIYRPQLTSVLSIANRITGVLLFVGACGLVAWLVAGASGPENYKIFESAISSWLGQGVLFAFTFALFLHFCGGIRHLAWDTVHGFALRSIYMGGWAVIAASIALTILAWAASLLVAE